MKSTEHHSNVMSDLSQFAVRICGCGVVHLCFGPTTLNITPEARIQLSDSLRKVVLEFQNPMTEGNVITGLFPNSLQS